MIRLNNYGEFYARLVHEETNADLFPFFMPRPVARCFMREVLKADAEDMVRGAEEVLTKLKWTTMYDCIKECFDKGSITKQVHDVMVERARVAEKEEKRYIEENGK